MDTERLKITAETAAIRGRGWLRLALRLVGIALVVAGANLLLGVGLWDGYRSLLAARVAVGDPTRIVHAADLVGIGVGAALAHFV